MKKVLLAGVITLASLSGFSQTKDSITYGVKAGVAFPTLSSSDNAESITSFYIGGIVNIPVVNFSSGVLSVQPGLSFITAKGAARAVINSYWISSESKVSTSYLEIPMNMVASFNTGAGKFFVGAGPYLSFALSSERTTKLKVAVISTDESNDLK